MSLYKTASLFLSIRAPNEVQFQNFKQKIIFLATHEIGYSMQQQQQDKIYK